MSSNRHHIYIYIHEIATSETLVARLDVNQRHSFIFAYYAFMFLFVVFFRKNCFHTKNDESRLFHTMKTSSIFKEYNENIFTVMLAWFLTNEPSISDDRWPIGALSNEMWRTAHIRKQKNALTFQGSHVTQTANMVVAATLGFGAALKVFALMI